MFRALSSKVIHRGGGIFLRRKIHVRQEQDYFVIEDKDFLSQVTFQWLRDHCRAQGMYDARTHQRLTNMSQLNPGVFPKKFDQTDDTLSIKWHDGHESKFDISWLKQNAPNIKEADKNPPPLKKLWNSKTIEEKDFSLDYDRYMNSEDGLKLAVRRILETGLVLIRGVPELTTQGGTVKTVERMVKIEENLFGKTFEFTSEQQKQFSDTAYTNLPLGPHTDMTYLTEASGLQVFHILREAEVGGETLLVDGFNVAKMFEENCPEGYEFFSRMIPVESEYIHKASRPHEHYYNKDFIFKHWPGSKKMIMQIRFNVYDRAPHRSLTLEEQRLFYDYYRKLEALIFDPENALVLKLKPGNLLMIDNWRILHGRKEFFGKRIMSGCYVRRDDFMSRAKALDLV